MTDVSSEGENYCDDKIEDGRDGGNIGFDDEGRGQYEDECQHMMTRIKLNYYRAEDEMLVLERWAQWKQLRHENDALLRKVLKNMKFSIPRRPPPRYVIYY